MMLESNVEFEDSCFIEKKEEKSKKNEFYSEKELFVEKEENERRIMPEVSMNESMFMTYNNNDVTLENIGEKKAALLLNESMFISGSTNETAEKSEN